MRKAIKVTLAVFAVWLSLTGLFALIEPDKKTSSQPLASHNAVQKEPITADSLYIELNKVRIAAGLTAFSRNNLLDKSSELKCVDMSKDNYYGHKDPTTGVEGYRYVQEVGQKAERSSENLNVGYFNTPREVVESWMNSDSHKASILDAQYTQVGFAVCTIPAYPSQIAVVQHKINPSEQASGTQQPVARYDYTRDYPTSTTTTCTQSDFGGTRSPVTTCKTN
jgi:uncharacterized protein YkwD